MQVVILAALHSLTQHLAMELAEHGIRINTVVPAVVETPIYGAFIKPDEVHKALQGVTSRNGNNRTLSDSRRLGKRRVGVNPSLASGKAR